MKTPLHSRTGFIQPGMLVASIFFGAIALFGLLVVPGTVLESTEMRIEPITRRVTTGQEFTTQIVLESAVPVNAFEGRLRFTEGTLEVTDLSLEGSIVDLWVRRPQYFNDRGIIEFAGGTTREGGFIGEGAILTVTFRGKESGEAALFIEKAVALQHDGRGTDAPLEEPVAAQYFVERLSAPEENAVKQTSIAGTYTVSPEPPPSPDLNGDGYYSISDVSIFMRNMIGYDPRYDFNQDNKVNTGDLSILLQKI